MESQTEEPSLPAVGRERAEIEEGAATDDADPAALLDHEETRVTGG